MQFNGASAADTGCLSIIQGFIAILGCRSMLSPVTRDSPGAWGRGAAAGRVRGVATFLPAVQEDDIAL